MFTGIVEELGSVVALEGAKLRLAASTVLENLERPVRLEDRLGGHLVQGHVDTVGEVVLPAPNLRVRLPEELMRYVVEKGSITVDGVSLTVVEVFADGFSVALIPHTCEVTTLGIRRAGDFVNLEMDVMAKYAESLLAGHLETGGASLPPEGEER
jgi:riboflavin synthase